MARRAATPEKPKKSTAKKTPAKKVSRAKKAPRDKKPPKAAPISRIKADPEMEGPRPLSLFDMQFCHIFVQTQKQVEAWRQLRPDDKDPYKAAHRMMQRPEIREHIKSIYKEISKSRQQAATVSARANLLALDMADDRLVEILQQPRKTLGQMLTRDTKQLWMKGANIVPGDDETDSTTIIDKELQDKFEGPAPVEDTDLLKAIKLTYDRKGGIVKAEKDAGVTVVQAMLYKPRWFGGAPSVEKPKTLEAARAASVS